jgi:hypothetical protein
MGLHSQVASRWNGTIQPRPLPGDPTLGDLFNWRYAQPLATNDMLCAIGLRWFETTVAKEGLPLVTYSPGHPIPFDADQLIPWPNPLLEAQATPPPPVASNQLPEKTRQQTWLPVISRPGNLAAFQGWGAPSPPFRWSQCAESQIHLRLGRLPPAAARAYLSITAAANGPQAMEVSLNGHAIGTLYRAEAQQTTSLDFPAAFLKARGLNVIQFYFPDAHYPTLWDQRPLGMAFTELRLYIPTH